MSVDDAEVRPPPPRALVAPRASPAHLAPARSRGRPSRDLPLAPPPPSPPPRSPRRSRLTSAPFSLTRPLTPSLAPRPAPRSAAARRFSYCRNAKPHVSHFQLAEDEPELVWVSKRGGKAPAVRLDPRRALGRSGSDLFRKSTGKDRDHAPELCLSVLYDEHESDLAKGKPARTLDLVCESPAKAATWARGLLLARDRARNPPPKPPPLSAKTAFLVSKAVNKFRKNKKPFPEEYDTGPIAEPGDVHVWGLLTRRWRRARLARAKAAADERERAAKDDARRTASERASLNPLLRIQPPASLRSSLASPPRSFPAWTGGRRVGWLGDRSAVGVSAPAAGAAGGTCTRGGTRAGVGWAPPTSRLLRAAGPRGSGASGAGSGRWRAGAGWRSRWAPTGVGRGGDARGGAGDDSRRV